MQWLSLISERCQKFIKHLQWRQKFLYTANGNLMCMNMRSFQWRFKWFKIKGKLNKLTDTGVHELFLSTSFDLKLQYPSPHIHFHSSQLPIEFKLFALQYYLIVIIEKKNSLGGMHTKPENIIRTSLLVYDCQFTSEFCFTGNGYNDALVNQ